ncbi:GlsB/YeaQ/YmgE family stress response membrane protein [Actinomadura soli]|uniref:GlsB/YeaQ/YmgE family stress response membrane protein n=1 Tax=Actinomadura soli TaxID=2508997 RepID=A0A5C4J5B5_9ACTN|nr:GlsB/YeaQ/YmgE family stress response membrane protein [Actinomadura soli]TMQ92165.1 GlsB/YeaQ/YmgE family stress response membrane protein [Actinomadura soli]
MGIIAWIILGLVAGFIAKALIPGRDPQGLIVTTLIGVAGALLGGFLATRLFDVDGVQGFFDLSTWITAIAGSAVLLLAYHLITSRSGGNGRRSGRRSGHWASRR